MDYIQIYVIILFGLNLILLGLVMGKGPIKVERDWISVLVSLGINIPIFGRIFGWW